MEPIPEDIVERAEDFFFKLDDNQVLEKITELQKSQPEIVFYIRAVQGFLNSKESGILLSRFILMADYCYRSYPVNLSIIKKNKISETMSENFLESHCILEPDGILIDKDATFLLLNQVYLTKVLLIKEEIYVGKSDYKMIEIFGKIWIVILAILHLYQDEAKNQMDKLEK